MSTSYSDKHDSIMDVFAGGVGEWIASLKDSVQKFTAEKECSVEHVLCAGASLLQEFCVLNWLGPAERDAASARFGWKVERAEWVSSCHHRKCDRVVFDCSLIYMTQHMTLHIYDMCDMYDSVHVTCVAVGWCVY